MIDDKKIDFYKDYFTFYYNTHKNFDDNFILNEESINDSISQAYSQYKDIVPDIELTDDEKKRLVAFIKSIYSVYQEEGSVILGDYEHDFNWHNNLLKEEGFNRYYWERYKNYLQNNRHTPINIIERLENNTIKDIMSYIGNPNDESPFSIRGLVVGDVQSGKTLNFIGLLTAAADAGYKVFFVLTGTVESLRKQTQQRIEEGFVGYDSVDGRYVGVGGGDKTPNAYTSRDKDFTGTDYQNTTLKISDQKEPLVFVVKKNVSVLKKIYTSLRKINTQHENQKIKYSMLMIDDEADNASINTKKDDDDPTKVNEQIRKILNLFEKTSYIGFTATPFANVFINYDSDSEMLGNDLFPRDFIYALKSPSNYYGASTYFSENSKYLHYIDDEDKELFSMEHKKDWTGNKIFPSFYHAINTFFIANAIRDIRDDDINSHRSMLINMSRFTNVQFVLKEIVKDYYDKVLHAIKLTQNLSSNLALTNNIIKDLKLSFLVEYDGVENRGIEITWDEVFHKLYDSIKNIRIIVVNSSRKSEKLNYDANKKNGLRVIAIGGLALSRGLTLENLMISYFYRNTSTFDVLMQMGRWFGYRDGYADLCKIFITEKSAEYYREIDDDIQYFKNDINIMGKQKKKPKDYGIRIRNASLDLSITAANKMRNTKKKIVRKSFYGNIYETPYLYRDLSINKNNIKETIRFLSNLSSGQRDSNFKHPYYRNVSKKYIEDLLSKLKIHEANETFDTKQLLKFLEKNDSELENFDVLIMGGDSEIKFKYKPLNIDMNIVKRKFDIKGTYGNEVIRVNAQRAHLWGRQDARIGLSKEQLSMIPSNARAQDFLIKDRDPLLIIYFIDLKNDFENSTILDYFTGETSAIDYLGFYLENDGKYFVGFAIGFPSKDGENTKAEEYTVNKTANYYDNEHEYEDEEDDDGNE